MTLIDLAIVDATRSNQSYDQVRDAMYRMNKEESRNYDAAIYPLGFVQEEYFGDNTSPEDTQPNHPHTIFLAQKWTHLVGFVITQNHLIEPSDWYAGSTDADTNHVVYLVATSSESSSDIKEALMLTAMQKTKESGKQYLSVKYPEFGDSQDFYTSLQGKMGARFTVTHKIYEGGDYTIRARYDLENFAFQKG